MTVFESGIRNRRVEFVPETTEGETPADPSWEIPSDRIINFTASPDANFDVDRAVGSEDPAGIERGPEDHELTIGYRLQRWLVDGSGAAQDLAGYGIVRDGDRELQSLSIVDREDRVTGGNDDAGVRLYTVVKGAKIGTVTITLDPDTGEPIPVECVMTAEKIRSYAIHQPSASTTLEASSDDAADTTQSLTIEDEDAGTSETIALNGTTAVTTTSSFANVDSISLDAETAGDVTVTDGSGTTIAVLRGSGSYEGFEGDLGVPPLGSGSHASALGTSFEKFLGDSITRDGAALALAIVGGELSVENNIETTPRTSSHRRLVNAGQRDVEMSATLVSELQSHDSIEDHLRSVAADIVWTADGGTVTLPDAKLTDVGDRAITPDEIVLQIENTFTSEGITVA